MLLLLKNAGFPCPDLEAGGRRMIFENPELGLRYFWVKPWDVGVYVERGVRRRSLLRCSAVFILTLSTAVGVFCHKQHLFL